MCNMNNFEFCNYCFHHILFNKKNSNDFLEKFLYKKINKKMIIMAFRLDPKLKDFVKFEYYNKISDNFKGIVLPETNISFFNMFEIYFFQENLTKDSFEKCVFCNKSYCPLHLKIAPFKSIKCDDCSKEIVICNECYHTKSKNILCAILHIL